MGKLHRPHAFAVKVERWAEQGRGARNRMMGPCFRRRGGWIFGPWALLRLGRFTRAVRWLVSSPGPGAPKAIAHPGSLPPGSTHGPDDSARDGLEASGASRAPGFRLGQSPFPVPAVSTGPGDRLRSGAPARGSDRPNRGMTRSRSTDPRRRFGAWYRGASPCDRDEEDYAGVAGGRGKLPRRFFFTPGPDSSSRPKRSGEPGPNLRGAACAWAPDLRPCRARPG